MREKGEGGREGGKEDSMYFLKTHSLGNSAKSELNLESSSSFSWSPRPFSFTAAASFGASVGDSSPLPLSMATPESSASTELPLVREEDGERFRALLEGENLDRRKNAC